MCVLCVCIYVCVCVRLFNFLEVEKVTRMIASPARKGTGGGGGDGDMSSTEKAFSEMK